MELLELRLEAIRFEAQGISSFELLPVSRDELPPFTAGAHIDLHMPNGLSRSYSLVNPQSERHRYLIGVNRDPKSRGGSRFMHESLRVGDLLQASTPRNNFPLDEDAEHSVFIAGGIGITPLWCMIQRLEELGRSWELAYCARNRQSAAFLDRLRALAEHKHANIHFNFDQEPGGRMIDLGSLISHGPGNAHFYCCGPLPMLETFKQATNSLPPDRVHLEYFATAEAPSAAGGFTVELAKSGRCIAVPEGKTILDALLDSGIDAPYGCMEGLCGSCETRVLEGIPDHRDQVLSPEEQLANDVMMICCSGSKSGKLVLDL